MAKSRIFQELEDLLEQAENIVNNELMDYREKWLMDRDFRTQTFESHPDCVLTIKGMGREIPFFPICNRTALGDPKFILAAIKIAKKFEGNPSVDRESAREVIVKLAKLSPKFLKEK